jgi:hypothetical protein
VALFDPFATYPGKEHHAVSLFPICCIDETDSLSVAAMNSAIKEETIEVCFFFEGSPYRAISLRPGESREIWYRIIVPGLNPMYGLFTMNCIHPEDDIHHISLEGFPNKLPVLERTSNVSLKGFSWHGDAGSVIALTDSGRLATASDGAPSSSLSNLRYIPVAGSVKHLFAFPVSENESAESTEGKNMQYKYVAVGNFSSIEGVEVHNFANLYPYPDHEWSPVFKITPVFSTQISLDTYDELSVCPVYMYRSNMFLPVEKGYLLRGKFKKVNGLDVDGCVCISLDGEIYPILDIFPNGLLFPSVSSFLEMYRDTPITCSAVFVLS